jgi:hypothetical protein
MEYKKHYNLMMERAKTRELDGYFETHHIVPRCLGGSDLPDNLVQLTPEEHFVAHQLLIKMYPGNLGIAYAVICMSGKTSKKHQRSNKLYGWLRRRASEARRGRSLSEETRARMSAAKQRDREKIRQSLLGKKHTEETKQKMRKPKKFGEKPNLKLTVWINNGVINRRIVGEVPEGWTLGRIGWKK